LYGFKESKGIIDFGKIANVHTLDIEFVQGKSTSSLRNNALSVTPEWISAVYQDNQPINVIGVYRDNNGEVKLSTFGYGTSLAKQLDSLEANEKIVYEFPTDSWYAFSQKENNMRSMNNSANELMGKSISLSQYQESVVKRYGKDLEQGKTDTAGGVSTETEPKKKSLAIPVFISLGLASIVFLLYRKRKVLT
jgi:hypothetical protein